MGETFFSIKEDYGIYVFKNGDRYVGEWKNKIMEGRGIYIFYSLDPAHRIVYLGDFHNSCFSGFGKLASFH